MQDIVLSLDFVEEPKKFYTDGRFCYFEDGHLVIVDSASNLYSGAEDRQSIAPEIDGSPIYIGSISEKLYFVQQLKSGSAESRGLQKLSLRSVVAENETSFAILGRGLQLLHWRSNHQYCGRCGNKTIASSTEHATKCPGCESTFYPKIMPCVMALVTKGEYCLLARHEGRASSIYTALAGFIEAGESAEHAVYREVLEEVGIQTGALSYFSSQSWPFPGQLMLAFYADYKDGQIVPDHEEIADAQWFHKSELPEIPPEFTVSGKLIRAFAEAKTG